MQYDPIKRSLGVVFNSSPVLRKLFYKLLDLLLLRAWHIKRELRRFKKINNSSVKILDAGAGFGQYCYFMSNLSKKWTIKGVEIKDEQVEDCNQFFSKIKRSDRVNFEVADLTKFNEKEEYNLVLSVDVMEHIEDDIGVFRNINAALKKDGMLLISTPSDQGGSDVHDEDEHSFIDEHVRDGYNINDIQEKLKNAGFSKIEAKYTYGTPGKISWKLSMKFPIVMLNESKVFFILLPFYYLIFYPFCFILNFFDLIGKHKTGTGLIVKAIK